jgi:hypothetical protein
MAVMELATRFPNQSDQQYKKMAQKMNAALVCVRDLGHK